MSEQFANVGSIDVATAWYGSGGVVLGIIIRGCASAPAHVLLLLMSIWVFVIAVKLVDMTDSDTRSPKWTGIFVTTSD